MAEHVALKKNAWGTLAGSGFRTTRGTRSWISFGAGRRKPKSAPGGLIVWLDITASKFYDWRER